MKGLQELKCNAIQVCACFRNDESHRQKWIDVPEGIDEMELTGCMISGQVYTFKAGTANANTKEFLTIAEGKVNTSGKLNLLQ